MVFLIFVSMHPLLVRRKRIDFCMLILYSETLLNSSFILGGFLFFVFLWVLRDLPCRQLCHLQIGVILFLAYFFLS